MKKPLLKTLQVVLAFVGLYAIYFMIWSVLFGTCERFADHQCGDDAMTKTVLVGYGYMFEKK